MSKMLLFVFSFVLSVLIVLAGNTFFSLEQLGRVSQDSQISVQHDIFFRKTIDDVSRAQEGQAELMRVAKDSLRKGDAQAIVTALKKSEEQSALVADYLMQSKKESQRLSQDSSIRIKKEEFSSRNILWAGFWGGILVACRDGS